MVKYEEEIVTSEQISLTNVDRFNRLAPAPVFSRDPNKSCSAHQPIRHKTEAPATNERIGH